uniref:Putative secreted protein n=1 Tax=Anopheles darlingi TaxID=43151 RepID=A0A2M4DM30_ANODA
MRYAALWYQFAVLVFAITIAIVLSERRADWLVCGLRLEVVDRMLYLVNHTDRSIGYLQAKSCRKGSRQLFVATKQHKTLEPVLRNE